MLAHYNEQMVRRRRWCRRARARNQSWQLTSAGPARPHPLPRNKKLVTPCASIKYLVLPAPRPPPRCALGPRHRNRLPTLTSLRTPSPSSLSLARARVAAAARSLSTPSLLISPLSFSALRSLFCATPAMIGNPYARSVDALCIQSLRGQHEAENSSRPCALPSALPLAHGPLLS